MIKKFFILIVLLGAGAITMLYMGVKENPTLIIPYPYSFSTNFDESYKKEHAEEIQKAQEATILIMGDSYGLELNKYLEGIKDEALKKNRTKLDFFNWSSANEGFFRTNYKLHLLKKIPPLVIYFGASSELFEERFNVLNKKTILENFNRYDNENLISLIMTFPDTSKFIYKAVDQKKIGELKLRENFLPGPLKLSEKELSYKIFEYEVNDFINTIRDKKSRLIVITTPINLLIEPKEICAHSENQDIIDYQQEISEDINNGAYKSAYTKAYELSETTFSNARSFYLLGLAAKGQGLIKEAREAFVKASIFDCKNWRGSPIYNAILKNKAEHYQSIVIDFEQHINSQLASEDALFLDEVVPQPIYYQALVKDLSEAINKVFNLK